MPQLRHCKKISATLTATFCAATSSINFGDQAFAAENKKSIAMTGVAHTTAVKKAPVPTKSPDLKSIYPRTHFEKAFYFKQKHDLNNALIEFLKSTQENPLLVRGFYEQALIFRERGYLKLAASSLEQALAVKPDYQDARILLATISIQQGNVGGAVRELTRSLGLDPSVTKTGAKPSTTLQKVTEEVSEKVKDADALFDAMPSVILQSIHPEIKGEKKKELAAPKESTQPEEAKTAVAVSSTDAASSETNNKHFDLASIKDSITESIKDSFEAAMHAPLSLSTYWNHLPFGNSQPIEKTQEQLNDKTVNQTGEQTVETKVGRHKKEKKPKRKHKREVPSKAAVNQPTDQSEHTKSENLDPPKSDTTDTTATLPDFVKKAIADHREAEETAVAASQAASEQKPEQDEQSKIVASPESNKTLFSSANFSQSTHAIIKGLKTADNAKDEPQAGLAESTRQSTVKLDTDEWAVKLRDLVEHGTNSLKDGEAFMFAEDTGEASLFLADGSVIRRIVQLPRDQTEIVRQRRPDMLIPDDLLYKLSLLGKLIPHPETTNTQAAPSDLATGQDAPQSTTAQGKDFKVDNVMGESQNFWGWLKNAFKF
jgi:hypothetical protein